MNAQALPLTLEHVVATAGHSRARKTLLADVTLDVALKGADLVALGFAKGPLIGQALKEIEENWIAEGFAGSKSALLQAAREILEQVRK